MSFGIPNSFYQLSCELFPSRLASDIILNARNFNDITLVSDDDFCPEEFPANKAILSSSSKFLESVLINAFDPHPKLFLQGVKNEDMRLILDYIYTGVVEVEEKSVARLMEIGSQLQIKDIMQTVQRDLNWKPDANHELVQMNEVFEQKKVESVKEESDPLDVFVIESVSNSDPNKKVLNRKNLLLILINMLEKNINATFVNLVIK